MWKVLAQSLAIKPGQADLVRKSGFNSEIESNDRSIHATDIQLRRILAPLRFRTYRRVWLASLLANLGILMQGVGAAWAMTQMTSSADQVALVQKADCDDGGRYC